MARTVHCGLLTAMGLKVSANLSNLGEISFIAGSGNLGHVPRRWFGGCKNTSKRRFMPPVMPQSEDASMRYLQAKLAAGAALLILGGCATEPYGPTIPVMPGPGKSMDQFQADDAACQQYASDRVAGRVNDVNNRALGTAVIGTALGAGLGAAVGNGRGAAIGAASGAVVGSSMGANQSAWGQRGIQRQYNIAYAQCMTSKGHQVARPRMYRYPPPPAGYGPPPAAGYGPPPPPPPGNPPPPPPGE